MELVCCVICSMAAYYLMTKIQTFHYLEKIEEYTDCVLKATMESTDMVRHLTENIRNKYNK